MEKTVPEERRFKSVQELIQKNSKKVKTINGVDVRELDLMAYMKDYARQQAKIRAYLCRNWGNKAQNALETQNHETTPTEQTNAF